MSNNVVEFRRMKSAWDRQARAVSLAPRRRHWFRDAVQYFIDALIVILVIAAIAIAGYGLIVR